jgi:hypothetical protein
LDLIRPDAEEIMSLFESINKAQEKKAAKEGENRLRYGGYGAWLGGNRDAEAEELRTSFLHVTTRLKESIQSLTEDIKSHSVRCEQYEKELDSKAVVILKQQAQIDLLKKLFTKAAGMGGQKVDFDALDKVLRKAEAKEKEDKCLDRGGPPFTF